MLFICVACTDNNGRPPGGLKLREGAKHLAAVYNAWPDSLADIKAYAAKHCTPGSVSIAATPIQDAHLPPATTATTAPTTKAVVGGDAHVLDVADANGVALKHVAGESVASGTIAAHRVDITAASGAGAATGNVVDSEQVVLVAQQEPSAPVAVASAAAAAR